jgi:DNA repair protein RadD
LLTATLQGEGVDAAAVLGTTPKAERDDVLDAFKAGALRCVVNVGIATTGFDAPAVDLLALCRPTASTALHVQMLGRGMRPAPGKLDALVLDFAGNVRRLGSPTAPRVPTGRKGDGRGAGDGEAIVERGDAAPYRERLAATVDAVDPMTGAPPARVLEVGYVRHEKRGKPPSLRVVYRLDGIGPRSEWWALQHPNAWARRQARQRWRERAPAGLPTPSTVDEALRLASCLRVPPAVRVVPRPGKPDEVVPLWGGDRWPMTSTRCGAPSPRTPKRWRSTSWGNRRPARRTNCAGGGRARLPSRWPANGGACSSTTSAAKGATCSP